MSLLLQAWTIEDTVKYTVVDRHSHTNTQKKIGNFIYSKNTLDTYNPVQ